jgi:pSer/pThr/pTyr-binding forkhead associated (FHA) protein
MARSARVALWVVQAEEPFPMVPPESAASASEGRRAALRIRTGDFEGTRYELGFGETLIGRNPTTDITLLDEGASREHAIVLYDEEEQRWSIEDLQSTNGTKVNGKRVRSHQLEPGDEIQIGHTRFEFVRED